MSHTHTHTRTQYYVTSVTAAIALQRTIAHWAPRNGRWRTEWLKNSRTPTDNKPARVEVDAIVIRPVNASCSRRQVTRHSSVHGTRKPEAQLSKTEQVDVL